MKSMSKLSLTLVIVSVVLTAYVKAMKGGQILHQPLLYTVYILTGDAEDVFYMQIKKEQTVKMQEGVTARWINSSSAEERHTAKERINNSPSQNVNVMNTAKHGFSGSGCHKAVPTVSYEVGVVTHFEDGTDRLTSQTDKQHVEGCSGRGLENLGDTQPAGKDIQSRTDKKTEIVSGSTAQNPEPRNITVPNRINDAPYSESIPDGKGPAADKSVDTKKTDQPSSKDQLDPGAGRSEKTASVPSNRGKASTSSDGFVRGSTTLVDASKKTGCNDDAEPDDPAHHVNSSKSEPHCKLAAAREVGSPPKPPRPQRLWRFCYGVVYNEKTILTGGICFARSQGQHFFISVNAKNHSEAQEVAQVVEGRHLFDFRVIQLNGNQTLPANVPDWRDEETVYWDIEEISNSSRTGIVPSFGYPPKVAALKLLPVVICQRIYDELLEAHSAQATTLPGFLPGSVVCATQADKPVKFPDGKDLVIPGLACPDSLGAPFVLDDGTVLGVLVAADCKFKNVAFFQTLAQGTPTAEEAQGN